MILSDFTRSFFIDSKSRKTCADPKKCRQDRYEYAAVRPVGAISRVSQQGLRDYSYPEADHAYGFTGNINSIRETDKQAT